MCYICNCFSWTLDFIQRVITFCLSCVLADAICCGFIVAMVAGVAYGYNYSMAEFLTFTRSDVTVYLRRGQFHDGPDNKPKSLRDGDDDVLYPANITDYEDKSQNSDTKPLSEIWLKAEDTRKYAERLTKYAANSGAEEPSEATEIPATHMDYKSPSTHILRHIFVSPNTTSILSTTLLQSGSSEIVMRKFEPVDITVTSTIITNEDNYYTAPDFDEKKEIESITTSTKETIDFEDITKRKFMPYHDWESTGQPTFDDYSKDVDEDAVVYRP